MSNTLKGGMEYLPEQKAAWWKRCLDALLLGREVVTVLSYDSAFWKPEIRQGKLDAVYVNEYSFGCSLSVHTDDFGMYPQITHLELRAEERSVVTRGVTPSGSEYWWAFKALDHDREFCELFRYWSRSSLGIRQKGNL